MKCTRSYLQRLDRQLEPFLCYGQVIRIPKSGKAHERDRAPTRNHPADTIRASGKIRNGSADSATPLQRRLY